jgi:hypothetical protein
MPDAVGVRVQCAIDVVPVGGEVVDVDNNRRLSAPDSRCTLSITARASPTVRSGYRGRR